MSSILCCGINKSVTNKVIVSVDIKEIATRRSCFFVRISTMNPNTNTLLQNEIPQARDKVV